MSKKKILILGGAYSQLPLIRYAKEAGLHVVTADYLPNNPGHKLADEYYNISTVEKEQLLSLAQKLNIAGVSAYASDPAALTAAYISEKLGLVGPSFEAARVLSDKVLFRNLLKEMELPHPWFYSGSTPETLQKNYPGGKAIMKPVDSSGSKGLKFIQNTHDIKRYFDDALRFSRSGMVILEQYIERKGPQLHGEGFVQDGKLVFLQIGDQTFSEIAPLAPVSTLMPTIVHRDMLPSVGPMIKRVLQQAGFKTGGINVELIRDVKDRLYVVEIGARNGGNFMPQLIYHASGFDLPKANVDALLGNRVTLPDPSPRPGRAAQVILHSMKNGYFNKLNIPEGLRKKVLEQHLYCKEGDPVRKYENSREVVGVIILNVDEDKAMGLYLKSLENWEWVMVDPPSG